MQNILSLRMFGVNLLEDVTEGEEEEGPQSVANNKKGS